MNKSGMKNKILGIKNKQFNQPEKRLIMAEICGALICLEMTIFFIITVFNQELLYQKNIVKNIDIEVISYNKKQNEINIAIEPNIKQVTCAVNDKEDKTDNLEFNELEDNKCYVTVPFDKQYVYFKNKDGIVSEAVEINDYVVDLNLDDKYYLAINDSLPLEDKVLEVGNVDIKWVASKEEVQVEDNVFKTDKKGKYQIKAYDDNDVIKEIDVTVTDAIVEVPQMFSEQKPFLECEHFSKEEADLLDEILAYRIEQAGEGTRAGVVAAARFLTLEFPYRISYYWESGRVNNTGTHYVDGEGRYYKKGLYLHESKFEDIKASFFGPAIWGCKMVSYEDDPPNFVPGRKYPNGLDCSGFVVWSIFNGGFEIGDIGSYMLPRKGISVKFSSSIINSDKIKVGDLFNINGHIALLIGIDDNHYYVAESLNNYKGVVVKKYQKNKITNYFTHVVFMDSYYKEDGNITNMWY